MREDIKDNRNMRIGTIDRQLNGCITIYDKSNYRIGEIRPEGHRLYAFDKSNYRIAYWDENSDTTYDYKTNRRIDKGNLLVSLFFQN